jgi:hypothetical protein
MASAAPSSNSREMSVLKAFRRKPMIIRFMTRKMIVPRRIVQVGGRGLVELESFSEDQPGRPEKFEVLRIALGEDIFRYLSVGGSPSRSRAKHECSVLRKKKCIGKIEICLKV